MPGCMVYTCTINVMVEHVCPKKITIVHYILHHFSWFSGQHAEFHDAKFVAEGDGREGTCVGTCTCT